MIVWVLIFQTDLGELRKHVMIVIDNDYDCDCTTINFVSGCYVCLSFRDIVQAFHLEGHGGRRRRRLREIC